MNRHGLGVIQTAIVSILNDGDTDMADIYQTIRKTHYNSSTSKNQSRQAIKRAIRSLQKRGIIEYYKNHISFIKN